jgi:hypothetical protein
MWECKKCHEHIDDNWQVCWKCGTSKEGVEDPSFRSADYDSRSTLPRFRRAVFRLLLAAVLFNVAVALTALLITDRSVFQEAEVQRLVANQERVSYELLTPPTRSYRWALVAVVVVNVALIAAIWETRGRSMRRPESRA